MASTLGEMVAAIAPTIPETLMSSSNVAAIDSVAQHFPLTLGTTVGFECPLTAPEPAADFFLRVSGDWGRSLLAGQPESPPILAQIQWAHSSDTPASCPLKFTQLWAHPTWQHIRQAAQRWSEPTSLLHDAIDDIWLEFDIGSSASHGNAEHTATADARSATPDLPVPSSFLGIASPGLTSLDWIGQIALPTLMGSPLSPRVQTTLQECLAALPASARVFQVGTLSGRVPETSPTDTLPLRLYVQNLALSQLPSLLERLSWPGDKTLLTQLLTRIDPLHETCSLQLELIDSQNSSLPSGSSSILASKIGIECVFPHRAAWQKVLSRLVMLGFCRSDRAQALLDYPGYVRAQNCPQFPPLLKQWSAQLAPYRECLLVKRLAYLKFTYEPGHPLQAKAYLGLSPTWIDARYLNPNVAMVNPQYDQESTAIRVCKDLIQQLDYGEIDVDELFAYQRSQKSRWLNKALETMCVGG